MPITHEIDDERKLVRFTVTGTMEAREMVAAIDAVERELGSRTGYRFLSDHRGIDQPATRDQLETLVGRLGRDGAVFRHNRCAMVVATAASYGMMRMLSVMVERIPMELEVFEDVQSAERWLGVAPLG